MVRLRALLIGCVLFGAFWACGPDPKPTQPCDGPDFDVVISAANGFLPADTQVVLTYGSGREEFRLDQPPQPEVLFCTPLDGDGQPLEAGAPMPGGDGAGGAPGAVGVGGAGGAADGHASGAKSLRCTLWTQGPASLLVKASGYDDIEQELKLESGKCTVEKTIELVHEDGGAS